ncbi:MAG TPA: hypothetical protein VFD75_14275, partial [Pyrinomonadaceae bacterium]|nr:hypothetical protein [Pyrinomonadaceae bacterium]
MALSRLLNSFRVRLLLLLALVLVLTVSVQYYVNLRAVRSNAQFIVEQQQAIMAGVALGVNSLSNSLSRNEYLDQMREEGKIPMLDKPSNRVQNVLIVDESGNIKDSLDKNQTPRQDTDSPIRYVKLKDISLPPLKSAVDLPEMSVQLPEGMTVTNGSTTMERGAYYFPVDTDKGRRYIIVVVGSANSLTSTLQHQSRRSLLWTLAVLFTTACLTAIVVWRFTRPIKFLSTGARRIAGGDLSYRVP